MAMGRLAEKLSGTLDFTWTWNGKQQPVVKSAKAVFTKELSTSPASGNIIVKNEGKGALSVDLITRTQLLNDTLPAISNTDITYSDDCHKVCSLLDIIYGYRRSVHIRIFYVQAEVIGYSLHRLRGIL